MSVLFPARLATTFRHISKIQGLERTIEQLRPFLRGWMNDFQYIQGPRVLEHMEILVRRRMRVTELRQRRRPATCASRMRSLGLDAHRA
ncbi:group II intron maturase-specific domain-containing protein [Paucibacter sp. PLA-PC-4]|uniref:group II intron maturase-specific domain-containing protein n=1 Tax=Paucibacter sp. PLA-PC-4 TaxID=2993655 RepID=UPI003A4C5B7C